jgi:ribosomal protein S18 acetylase RimI-like enzyme
MAAWLRTSRALAGAGRGVRLVADKDGKIVGCGQLLNWLNGGEIADLIVIPSHRNQGIGEALVKALLEYARHLRMTTVEIGVEAENLRARALYERLGFSFHHTIQIAQEGRPLTIVYLKQNV